MGSVERGHYIAFVRGAEQWFCIDDEEVRTVDWEAVALQKAYMLFYHAVPPPPPPHCRARCARRRGGGGRSASMGSRCSAPVFGRVHGGIGGR